MRKILILPILLFFTFQLSQAQCTFPAGSPNGLCTNAIATDGLNINAGQTFAWSGAATTFSTLNINTGGTLQVCGTLTIQNLNFNGGTIVIMNGGSLTLAGGINIGTGGSLTNHGTVTINNNLNVGGTDGAFINYGTANVNTTFALTSSTADFANASPTAIFNAGSNTGSLSGEFVNLGHMTFGQLNINGGSDLCLGPNSSVTAGSINNNINNGIVVEPAGSNACIRYTGNALLNMSLTNAPNLLVCQAPGATTSGAGGFGAAQVTPNCPSCNLVLPVVLAQFSALSAGNQISVSWKSSSEDNVDGYGLEQSTDGNSFAQVAFIPAKNVASSYQYNIPLQQSVFLRLRMQDRDGRFSHSKIIYVKVDDAGTDKIRLLCSPCYGEQLPVRLITREPQQGRLIVSNFAGQVLSQLKVQLDAGQQDLMIPTTGLAAGLYTVKFIGSRYSIGPVRWMKGK